MKIALYPGSFNPFHEGHADIVNKALKVFDKVIICHMDNPEKKNEPDYRVKSFDLVCLFQGIDKNRIDVDFSMDLMVNAVKKHQATAVMRGLRNGYDLQYEQNLQYWNEDIGLTVPVVYFVTDRKYSHISSSAIRQLREFVKNRGVNG